MSTTPVIAVFDIGKTNKKLFLLDKQYGIVLERCIQLDESRDEDGDVCEDLRLLTQWVKQSFHDVIQLRKFSVEAVNFSAYGASLVHLNKEGIPVTPLYSYLKPYSELLLERFYRAYGPKNIISAETASPALGSLNSGMQMYRLKHEKPERYHEIKYSLHLPQYIGFLITGQLCSEMTSIGCHTQLWDFKKNDYHKWVYDENIVEKLPPIFETRKVHPAIFSEKPLLAGVGMHDSSAALIPYLASFSDPFILISTGTWCISLNPFDRTPLTEEELNNDCLCFIEYRGNTVKASRLFAGHEHELQVARLAAHFNKPVNAYKKIKYQQAVIAGLEAKHLPDRHRKPYVAMKESAFAERDLSAFNNYEQAYHCLVADIMEQQRASVELVMNDTRPKRIFVDGGFSGNAVYMNLLADAFPGLEVFAASVAQSTAIGAALAIHPCWNEGSIPSGMIELKYYKASEKLSS